MQVSDALLSLLLADEREALKITSTGLKLFERQEMKGKQTSKCNYRIAQVGCAALFNACICCEHIVTARLARQVACMGMHNMQLDTNVYLLHRSV